MHYGLQHEDDEETFYVDRLHKVIQLTPCAGVVNMSNFTNEIDIDVEFLNDFLGMGVYHIGGPNWGSIDEEGTTANLLCNGYKFK